jgi:mannan endo-1,4-beta-mannosidase
LLSFGVWVSAIVTLTGLAACSGALVVPGDVDTKTDAARPDAGRALTDAGRPPSTATRDAGKPATSGGTGGVRAGSYHVDKGLLFDGCGEQVVLRGVNHPTMYVDRAGKAMAQIARTGANAVRLFWFAEHGVAIGEAESAIDAAVENGMVPMLELHDSTCKWDLSGIVAYWTSSDAVALIERHQKHLLINLANEASPPDGTKFRQGYGDAVRRMRTAGIHVPIVIDGGGCGRNYQMLLDNGPDLLDQDPDHNLIFSAHLYDPMSALQYGDLFDRTAELELPFIVGEFAHKQPPGCGAGLDYKSLVAEAARADVGWLAWSWGDDNASTQWNTDCGEFDMTSTFSVDTLTGWGKDVAVSLATSIEKTAVRPYALLHDDICD